MIPNACYQANVANMVISLIAYLTKDWQLFFVFLNLVASPIIMAFMLFHESPRWLVATGRMSKACNVRTLFSFNVQFLVEGRSSETIQKINHPENQRAV